MKKRILSILVCIVAIFFVGTTSAQAANANINVSSSAGARVVVGASVTVTVKISSSVPLGSWNFDVSPSSNLKLTYSSPGGLYVVDVVDTATQYSKTYTFKFTATSSGTASVSIKNSVAYAYDLSSMTRTNGSVSFSVLTQAQIEALYSKNNYLSTLGIDGATLAPVFNKDTIEYTVELVPETTSINVTATAEDGKSSITGAGAREVADGVNRLEVIVTAENGSTKTYVINATVKEYNPIEVKIGSETYSVVRKKSLLVAPSTSYTETTVKLNEEDIPAFTSETTKYTLVGLKDSEGNIAYYIYNAKNNSYTLYRELSFSGVVFYPMEMKDIPEGYKKTSVKYSEASIVAYKIKTGSQFALLYGMNIQTGQEGYYLFDIKDSTLQRYNTEEIDTLNTKVDLYFKIAVALAGVIILGLVTSLILLSRKLAKNKALVKKISIPNDALLENDMQEVKNRVTENVKKRDKEKRRVENEAKKLQQKEDKKNAHHHKDEDDNSEE